MTTTDYSISKEDKLALIDSHVRQIEISKYTSQLIIIEQEALETPEPNAIARATAQIADCDAQLVALSAQRTAVNAE
jgi:hypothetical protein